MRVSSAGGFLGYLGSGGEEWLAQSDGGGGGGGEGGGEVGGGCGERCWIRGGSKVKGGGEGRPGEEGWRPVRY